MRSELASARAAAKPATDADTVEALLGELAEEQCLRHEAEAARAAAETALEVALAERTQALLATPRQSLPRTRLHDEISDVLASLMPHLNLLRDSLTVAASEYSSRKALYRSLAELASMESRLPRNWKSVQGAAGWWERHVSDGQDNTGRIYALYVGEARRWDVMISDGAASGHGVVAPTIHVEVRAIEYRGRRRFLVSLIGQISLNSLTAPGGPYMPRPCLICSSSDKAEKAAELISQGLSDQAVANARNAMWPDQPPRSGHSGDPDGWSPGILHVRRPAGAPFVVDQEAMPQAGRQLAGPLGILIHFRAVSC